MNVRLILERKRKRIWTAQMRRSEATLGRAMGCTIRIPSAEVSRLHCRLRIENGLVFVEDLESVNGTFVNGEPVRGSEIVHPGDRLSLGSVTFLVEYELTQEALKHLGSDEDVVLEADDDIEVVEGAAVPPVDSAPVLEPVEQEEEAGEEMFQLEEEEEMHLPGGDDLRDFLIELDDTDEPSK